MLKPMTMLEAAELRRERTGDERDCGAFCFVLAMHPSVPETRRRYIWHPDAGAISLSGGSI